MTNRTRYYQATDGNITVFRATNTRAYQSARFDTSRRINTFSASPAVMGSHPATEITKSEYEALQALKVERIKCAGRDPKRFNAPYHSWVANEALS